MGVEIYAPSSLDDITLRQYQEFYAIGDDATSKDVLRIFLNVPESVIEKIPYTEVERIKNIILSLFEGEKNLHGTFKLKGIEYGFEPVIDQAPYSVIDDAGAEIGNIETVHIAMAVLYRPIIKRKKGQYLTEEYSFTTPEKEELMKDIPLSVAFGAMFFFLHLAKDLLSHIPNFMMKDKEVQKALLKNGDGIIHFIRSLKMTVQDMEKRLESQYMKLSTT